VNARPSSAALVLAGCAVAVAIAVACTVAATWSTAGTAAAPPLKTMELGKGPTCVFVHDLGSRGSIWMPVARRLLANHRVVLVDLPGHGESPMSESFSFDLAAQALGDVLARQEGGQTVVVGHGLGGTIALLAARRHPERLRGLVLIGAAARLDVPDQQKKLMLQMLDEQYDTIIKGMFTQLGRDSAQGVAVHAQAAMVPAAVMKAYLREVLYADAAPDPRFALPVLFIGPDRAWPAGKDWPAVAREVGLEGLRTARGVRFANCGHYVMTDQPDSLVAALDAFAGQALAGN